MRFLVFAAVLLLSGRVAASQLSFYRDDFARLPTADAMTHLGRELFSDPRLSASGRVSCATCHDPHFAYGPSPASPQLRPAGRVGVQGTVRAIPSLRYMQDLPPFNEHHFDEAIDESVDQGPTGGHMWDGRADSLHEQARLPLFSTVEMANTSESAVVARVAQSPYAREFRDAFGDDVFQHPGLAFRGILRALEVFQQSPSDFYPYSSKYDGWLRGKVTLSAGEIRGLRVFNDPKKGNCANCHPSQIRAGSFPQFTDFGYVALGVPRNHNIAANRDPNYFDLGLCGPERVDLRNRAEYCGLFRAPTLRNVALRRSFFHNGVFTDLRQAVRFYARRDRKLDDLPVQYRANLNNEAPFTAGPGAEPALSEADIDDLVEFLKTLTDGYRN
jgi:cytochrome c peroxidase